jgi:hypothetical protein
LQFNKNFFIGLGKQNTILVKKNHFMESHTILRNQKPFWKFYIIFYTLYLEKNTVNFKILKSNIIVKKFISFEKFFRYLPVKNEKRKDWNLFLIN